VLDIETVTLTQMFNTRRTKSEKLTQKNPFQNTKVAKYN